MSEIRDSKQDGRPARVFPSFGFGALNLFRISIFGFRIPSPGLVALSVLSVLLAGCAGHKKAALTEEEIRQRTYAPLPAKPDEITISGETIACEDIMMSPSDEDASADSLKQKLETRAREVPLDQFVEEARPLLQQRLNRNITRIVLSKRARRELGAQSDEMLDKMAEKELRRFIIEEHGGNTAAADAALQQRGMNRAAFKERRKSDMLARYVIESKTYSDRPVTYGELLARYNEVKDQEFVREGVLQFRLIDIQVNKVRLEGPNDDPFAQARVKAAEARKKIDAGGDFAELARQYSDDRWASEGGLWRPRNPRSLAAPYDVLDRAAQNMKPGDVAGPIEEAGHLFIMKVEQKQDRSYTPLEEVQEQLRKDVLQVRRNKAAAELEAEIARQAALVDTTPFVNYCLEKLYLSARASSGDPR